MSEERWVRSSRCVHLPFASLALWIVGDPSVIRCRESFKTNGTIFATDRPAGSSGRTGTTVAAAAFFSAEKRCRGLQLLLQSLTPIPTIQNSSLFGVLGFPQSPDYTRYILNKSRLFNECLDVNPMTWGNFLPYFGSSLTPFAVL